MTAATMFDHHERSDVYRWTTSALIVAAVHGLLFVTWNAWPAPEPPAGSSVPPIMIELSPVTASPEDVPLDLAPGPVMQQSDSSTATSEAAASTEQPLALKPIATLSEVVLPAARPHATADQIKDKTHSDNEKTAQVKRPNDTKKASADHKPAPKATATPRAEHRARQAVSSRSGIEAMASVLPSYRDRLAAHLQRYKQYPPELRAAGIRGVAKLTFTVNRSGYVLASRLSHSSGNAALDAETMAMIRRAQPLPSFPPEITVNSMSFTVPVQFSVR